MGKLKIVFNGILKENPVLVLVLGTCPVLAVSVSVAGALGMGIAATFVLIGSNAVISALRKIIPSNVRIPCYITVIATFVTIVMMLIKAFVPSLYAALGVYLPLIVVNCIILGRAEMFAAKNKMLDSILDGIGMGLGFTLIIVIMASIRELLGEGSWFGVSIIPEEYTIGVMTRSPGGFLTYGLLMAALAAILAKKGKKPLKFSTSNGCADCPVASACNGSHECEEGAE
ncbi:MAG: electron transport complex subunit E [Ruminococcaceae bacterium]|nr:electron transport complex subunit E [Oscillospiraceae bacterium]